MFRGSVKSTGYPFHSTVSSSLPHPCVSVCCHISSALYLTSRRDGALLSVSRYVLASTE